MFSPFRQYEGMHADQALIANYAAMHGHRSEFREAPKMVVPVPELEAGGSVSLTMLIIAGMTLVSTGGALATPTSPTMSPWAVDQIMQPTAATGYRRKQSAPPSEMLSTIRLRLGLTWAEVAAVFEVSRRAAHSWASGGNLSSIHETKLRELHGRVSGSLDLAALKKELLKDAPIALEYSVALKGAILSSDETGITITAKAPVRRVPTAQLRRR